MTFRDIEDELRAETKTLNFKVTTEFGRIFIEALLGNCLIKGTHSELGSKEFTLVMKHKIQNVDLVVDVDCRDDYESQELDDLCNGLFQPKTKPTSDKINSPAHYTVGGLEVIDILKAKLSQEELRGYLAGNLIKYVMRSKHKNGLEDLKKAQWYLNKLVELGEKNGHKSG